MKENREKKRAFGGREEADGRVREGCLALARSALMELSLKWQILMTDVTGICYWSGRWLGLEWQVKEVAS